MKTLAYTFLVFLFSNIFYACDDDHPLPPDGEPPCGPLIDSEITAAVLESHLTGFGLRDVGRIMDDYTESSTLTTPEGVFKGLNEIQAYYENLLPAFPADGTIFEIDIQYVKEDIAYIVWHADTPALNVPLGSDTFVVQNGKIMRQTFVAQLQPK
ncbi:nuclear transport factor 2 family protein [Fulvivirga sp. 29W222]|uniref:Nuclear transport factor 2 family protein n=1 Tax=Fulvivirga marina TaxID=2494733 RepID=A0A937KGU5_9BACT|nr:nuclear transport factor 2 family protein [Fulvivirga marina]MBL6449810.1 nuclear transport factor 2 family protein [Fulvivirga marina]